MAVRSLGLAILGGVIATLCLWSTTGAAIVGACTLLAVAIDSRRARASQPAPPRLDTRLTVDLSRRGGQPSTTGHAK